MYARTINGGELEFAVSGKLWNRSLVMMDSQTQSLWAHLLGKCMQGQLKGMQLQVLPSSLTTWKSWKQAHPDTSVMMLSPVAQMNVSRFEQTADFVFGMVKHDAAKAWTFQQMIETPLINDQFQDTPVLIVFNPEDYTTIAFERNVSGVLTFRRGGAAGTMVDDQTGSKWNAWTGLSIEGPMKGKQLTQLPGFVSFIHAWNQFHPHSKYWNAK